MMSNTAKSGLGWPLIPMSHFPFQVIQDKVNRTKLMTRRKNLPKKLWQAAQF
jgi:hypothetical protein